jgi:hypothetical protein
VESSPGLRFRLVQGEQTMTSFVHSEPHPEAPVHTERWGAAGGVDGRAAKTIMAL